MVLFYLLNFNSVSRPTWIQAIKKSVIRNYGIWTKSVILLSRPLNMTPGTSGKYNISRN